jgi:AraC family transcriptional regulator
VAYGIRRPSRKITWRVLTVHNTNGEQVMLEHSSGDFAVVAAQLVEAACSALNGDGEMTEARIARAVALLRGKPNSVATIVRPREPQARPVFRGGLAGWQAKRVEAHMDAHLARKVLIDDLAGLVGLSNSQFCRAFKCSFGLPAHVYLMHRRIEVAQGLMLTTREPLSEIALKCGMSDQAHFTRTFRRVVGETPCSWRRTRRNAMLDQQVVATADFEQLTSRAVGRRPGSARPELPARVPLTA